MITPKARTDREAYELRIAVVYPDTSVSTLDTTIRGEIRVDGGVARYVASFDDMTTAVVYFSQIAAALQSVLAGRTRLVA